MATQMNNATMFSTPSDREIVMTHVFDAPKALVFRAYTDPALVPTWWGPRRYTTRVVTMDVRTGGQWRYVQSDDQGNEFAFRGEYREIVPPDRLVFTFEFEPMAGHVIVETITLEEHDGRTTLTDVSVFQSVDDRDGMLQSGMESGAAESMARLAEILRTLA